MKHKLFYLHGMGGSPSDWDSVRKLQPGEALAIPKDCHSPDGAGKSLAHALLKKDPESPQSLCGYSMGGRLAILAAKELAAVGHPLKTLILVSTGLGLQLEERPARIKQDEQWARLAETSLEDFWHKWYQQPLFSTFHALSEAERAAWLLSRKSINIESLTQQLRELGPGRHDLLTPEIRALCAKGLSVLYIVGEQDKKYLELAQQLRIIPGCEVRSLEGVGHQVPLEAPVQLATAIKNFIDVRS